MNWKPSHPAFQALLHAFIQQTTPVYVVGGVVRDFLLGVEGKQSDLDLTIDQAALPTAQRVADRLGWAFYPLDAARDVARLVFSATNGEPLICDIASLRGGSLETDLLARDFTVNAMAFALERNGEPRLIDICRGQADLANRIVRRVSAASLAEDAVRLLRAVRFTHQLNFTLDEETTVQIKRLQGTLRLASAERVRDELWKMLATDQPAQAIDDLQKLGLLSYVLPEISALVGVEQSYPHYQDVYHHRDESGWAVTINRSAWPAIVCHQGAQRRIVKATNTAQRPTTAAEPASPTAELRRWRDFDLASSALPASATVTATAAAIKTQARSPPLTSEVAYGPAARNHITANSSPSTACTHHTADQQAVRQNSGPV